MAELRANTTALAKLATLMKIPVITTASVPAGPNGPLMPEIHRFAPHAVYVPRKGEISDWENEDFVKTVHGTGKRKKSPSRRRSNRQGMAVITAKKGGLHRPLRMKREEEP